MPYPGRDPRAFLRGKNACVFDYLLVRTTNIPRWQHLAPRLTYMGYSARYSLWKIDHDRIPACRKPKKPPKPKPDLVSKEGKLPGPGAVPDTLRPSVGPTRGRRLDGERGRLPADRPSAALDKGPVKPGKPAATDRPMFVPRTTHSSSLGSRAMKALQEVPNSGDRSHASTPDGDPPRRAERARRDSVRRPGTSPSGPRIRSDIASPPRLRPQRKVAK